MLFTLFVAVLAAMLWALRSFYLSAGDTGIPHDPSTLELAVMAAITMATYVWMKRLRTIRQQVAPLAAEVAAPSPVPLRYADSVAEAAVEQALENAEQVA